MTGKDAPPRRARIASVALLLLWVMAVHLAYYAAHKPLDGQAIEGWRQSAALLLQNGGTLAGLAASVAALLVPAGLCLAALLIGTPIAGWFSKGNDWTREETLTLGGALGLGVIGTATLGLAAARMLTPAAVIGMLAALGIVACAALRRAPLSWKVAVPAEPAVPAGLRRILTAFVAVLALTFLLRSVAPPVAWDSLVYHLTGPKLWLQAGGLVWGLDLPHTYFPALNEHLYAAAMALGGERAAQPLHVAAALLTLALTAALAERTVARGAGVLAAAVLLSAASLSSLAGKAYVDWTLMLYATAALWAAVQVRQRPTLRGAALVGVLLGLAAATKYTAAGVAPGLVALLLTGTGPWRERVRFLVIVGAMATLVFLPWALRDLALTGNPVYPFVFGGWNWDGWRAAWLSRPGTGLVQEPWRLLLAPWELTTLGAEGGLLYDGTIGPVLLSLLPVTLLLVRKTPPLRPLALFAGTGYAVWLTGAATSSLLLQARLLYPVFPALAVLTAAALLSLRAWALPGVRVQRIVAAAVALDLALVVVGEVGRVGTERVAPVVAGALSPALHREQVLGEHARVVSGLDRTAGPSASVLLLWEPRSYLCPIACGPDAQLFNFRDALRRSGTPEAIAADWRARGYTHVLLHGAGLRYFTLPPTIEMEPEHLTALQAVERCCLRRDSGPTVAEALQGQGARYTLYRLMDPP